MRYATVTLTWTGERVHPVGEIFAHEESVSVEAIRYVSPVGESEYVELLELGGDVDRARTLLAESAAALEHDVTGDGTSGVAYVQCRTAGLVEDLLAVLHEHEIVLDWPMRFYGDDARGLRVTVIGTNRAIQHAAGDLPSEVELNLERTGEYEPDTGRLSQMLTERQLELFELAVREGYYEVPRETTQRNLAESLDLATATVSEHLQRIESKLVGTVVGPA